MGIGFRGVAPKTQEKRIEQFTGGGTWTVPAGVTFAIAHILGGGGGAGRGSSGNGASSSVAFASGTVTATGGLLRNAISTYTADVVARAGQANSGHAASYAARRGGVEDATTYGGITGSDGTFIVAGADVTPAASITVVVGAGGTAGTGGSAGGSGYVYIEYYEEV